MEIGSIQGMADCNRTLLVSEDGRADWTILRRQLRSTYLFCALVLELTLQLALLSLLLRSRSLPQNMKVGAQSPVFASDV